MTRSVTTSKTGVVNKLDYNSSEVPGPIPSALAGGSDIQSNIRRLCVTGLSLSQGFCYNHDSKLDQTRLHGPLLVLGNSTFHLIFMSS